MSLLLPPFTGWSIPDDGMATLRTIVQDKAPHLVLECGGGRSTPQLASYLRDQGHGRLISLDHLLAYTTAAYEQVMANDLAAWADCRWAPLVDHGQPDCLTAQWYSRRGWHDVHHIDLLVVDGPPGHSSAVARDPAVPLLHDRLAEGAVILLDDTNRSDEMAALDHWSQLLPGITWTHVDHSIGRLSWGVLP